MPIIDPSQFQYVAPLHVWVQKVLPLVYDDSLSYYEVLSKVVLKLNEIIEIVNPLGAGIEDTINQYLNEFKSEWEQELAAFQVQVNATINANNEALNKRIDDLGDTFDDKISAATGPIIKSVSDLVIKEAQDIANVSQQIQTTDANNKAWTLEQINAFAQTLPSTLPPIVDPTDGKTEDVQTVINHLFDFFNKNAITATEYDGLQLTATVYDGKGLTATQYDTAGKLLLDPTI